MRHRVLIVDDERPNRELLEIMLGPDHFDVQPAASGEEALAAVARQPPDIVLLDVMMPGMNGYEVTAAIRGAPSTRHIPIILITGCDDHESRVRGQAAGADEFLSRPVDRAALCDHVTTLLRDRVPTS
jgi:CheY-like chemotaxis protein